MKKSDTTDGALREVVAFRVTGPERAALIGLACAFRVPESRILRAMMRDQLPRFERLRDRGDRAAFVSRYPE